MYIGHGHMCVCVSVPRRIPTLLHGPGCNLEVWQWCHLVVHCWADLQSVHGFRCYDNSAQREMSASACTMPGFYVVEVYRRVKDARQGIFRPTLLETDDEDLMNMIRRCWAEEPGERPEFSAIKGMIKRINKYCLCFLSNEQNLKNKN